VIGLIFPEVQTDKLAVIISKMLLAFSLGRPYALPLPSLNVTAKTR
jgi:hypothetical protein